MSEFYDDPVSYSSVRHNYEHAGRTKPPRFRDDQLAIGGIVAAVLVMILLIVGFVALGVS
jgi:hypothetical protein